MPGPPTWAKISLVITVCLTAMNNPVFAKHRHGKYGVKEYAVLDQGYNESISHGHRFEAGRAFICPPNCEERGGFCYCRTPQRVQKFPPVHANGFGPSYICPVGCSEKGGLCYCSSPAQLVQGVEGPTYTCPQGCDLQYRSCLCFENPEMDSGPEGPASPPGWDFPAQSPSYICPEGCDESNGLCYCNEDPIEIPDTDPPEYDCREGCTYQEESNTCTCYYDPETSPDEPEGPDYPDETGPKRPDYSDESVARPSRPKHPRKPKPAPNRSKKPRHPTHPKPAPDRPKKPRHPRNPRPAPNRSKKPRHTRKPKPAPKHHDCCTCEPGKQLEYVSSSYNWFGAEQECRARSMRLVQIKCEEEEIVMEQLLRERGASRVFTGGVLMNYYGWTWEYLKKPFTYSKWKNGRRPSRTNEPLAHFTDYETESCMMVVRAGGDNYEWINDKCARTYPFVCERTNCNKSC